MNGADNLIHLSINSQEGVPLDFNYLREIGIQKLQSMAGHHWTDFNEHDPGITILEQLCYALTDLSYRSLFEVPDLLGNKGIDPYASIYTPEQILPTSPITITDLRKLLIDIPGVKNAWIDIVDESSALLDLEREEISALSRDMALNKQDSSQNISTIRIKGLMRVRIESFLNDTGEILNTAIRCLHQNRGLGQDYESIKFIEHQPIGLEARLEIAAVEDAAELLASIYQQIDSYMSPGIPRYNLEEMLEHGYQIDDIFDGPLLNHGFIDSNDLIPAEIRSSVRISDLIQILMSVPGVLAVKSINFQGGDNQEWLKNIEKGYSPSFAVGSSDIQLEMEGVQISIEQIKINAFHLYQVQRGKSEVLELQDMLADHNLDHMQGRDRNVANYFSIQHQFPRVYGIGPTGLPESASNERKAQASQLKAYLMFFDQLLANQFSQLANVGKLFSIHDNTSDSYFSQEISDDEGKLGLDSLRKNYTNTSLQQLTEGDKRSGIMRRNRFLDHMLARVGEQFHNYSLMQSAVDSDKDISFKEKMLDYKRAFLRDYPRISRDRGIAYNYINAPGEENISGLELALRRKFGVIMDEERFYLVEHILLRPVDGDNNQHTPLIHLFSTNDPYSLQLSLVFPTEPECYAQKEFIEQTVREMTPAHLNTRIIWKNKEDMSIFKTAYSEWLQHLRNQRCRKFGI